MGLYGSKDVGNLYTEKKVKKVKKPFVPQKNIWVWVVIAIWSIFFVSVMGVRFESVFSVLIWDSLIMGIISVITLIKNLIKRKEVGYDIIFLLSSIIMLFLLTYIFGAILNSVK